MYLERKIDAFSSNRCESKPDGKYVTKYIYDLNTTFNCAAVSTWF